VTGAAGFAGGHLLDQLAPEPVDLFCWHHPAGTPPHRHATAEARSGAAWHWMAVDLLDAPSVAKAVAEARPAQVYHLAGAAQQGKSWNFVADALRSNALATHHLLRAVSTSCPDARVLVTGSAAVYQPADVPLAESSPLRPASPYGFSKLAQERVALDEASLRRLPVIVTRPFNHIGPRQSPDFFAASFARQVAAIAAGAAEPVIYTGNLTPRRDLMDVRDTVRAYRLLMARGTPGEIYNVCAGRAWAIREILEQLIALSGIEVDVRVDTNRLRPVDVPLLVGSYEKLTRETGWQPAIPMQQTLRDLLASAQEALGLQQDRED
jgi:GDP-4-dehydro-6-deoxy-D-mannose reductase